MADNDTPQADRTEQPTPKRLAEARKRGQVPRSRELNMMVVMLAGAAVLALGKPFFHEQLVALMNESLAIPRDLTRDPAHLPLAFSAAIWMGLKGVVPLFIVATVAALLGPLALGGWAFSLESLQPKLEKLDPVAGLKRVFGWQGLSELLKAMAKFLLVAVVAAALLWGLAEEFLSLGRQTLDSALGNAGDLVARSFLALAAVLIVIAAADVPFQWWQHQRKLRMTKQELKDEQKDTEGRPEVRARIRSLQQEVATRRMMEAVPTADVVLTNPTHFAVALKYNADRMRAPKVVAKGTDLIALSIRRLAKQHGVPLFEHPPLTRAIYKSTSLGDEIPPRLYAAVAQVLTYIYQLQRIRPGAARPRPGKPRIDIDADMFERRPGSASGAGRTTS